MSDAPDTCRWRPMDTAPKDQLIEVLTDSREGLPAIVSECKWHPDAGWCVCEIREVVAWRPIDRSTERETLNVPAFLRRGSD